ncbi:MAG: addiction module protein [Polaribacter sp.]
MGTLELRNKLTEQFNVFIQDDSKLVALDGIFDSMNVVDSPSLVSEEHYKIVEERRRKYQTGKTKGSSWEEVRQNLKSKYGF